MLVMGHPQFSTQDDVGIGDGIPPVPEWQLDLSSNLIHSNPSFLTTLDLITDLEVRNVFTRLHSAFTRAQKIPFSSTRLHDLTCFVIHRLLLSAQDPTIPSPSPMTECIRYAVILYMFIIHGPTYYSHAVIMNTMTTRLINNLRDLDPTPRFCESLDLWLIAIGLVASTIAYSLLLETWNDAHMHIKSILWMENAQTANVFRPHWEAIFSSDHNYLYPGLRQVSDESPLPVIPGLEYTLLEAISLPSTIPEAFVISTCGTCP
jgi:hypothetical protein